MDKNIFLFKKKLYLQSMMTQDQFNRLALLSNEHELKNHLLYNDIIED